MPKDALVLDVQKMSTEDGPGIRTTVFFKGCNLRCAWCHNPESIAAYPQAVWVGARCIGCGACKTACQAHTLSFTEAGLHRDTDACTHCMACAKICPTGAMEQKGLPYTEEKLLRELLKDRAYYGQNGGVTASGGEPLLQVEFVASLFRDLRAAGIHTALDTAGCVDFAVMREALAATDLLLLDIKLADAAWHKAFTGADNRKILENAAKAAAYMAGVGKEIWVRTPIIPGATDSEENITAIGRFIRENMAEVVLRWELCAFNNLCRDKYTRLGMEWQYKDLGLLKRRQLENLLEIAKTALGRPEGVTLTGAAEREEA